MIQINNKITNIILLAFSRTDLHGVVDGGHDVPELFEKPLDLPGLDVPLILPQVGLLHALQRLSVTLGGQVVPGVKDFHEINILVS